MILQVSIEGRLEESFKELFSNSGLKSQAEYIRHLIAKEAEGKSND